MPQPAFLFSIAGLSVTLVGFSGLVAALRREARRTPLDTYRLRQIPEMALVSALVALITIPLADSIGVAATALRLAGVVALVLSVGHILLLFRRVRVDRIPIRRVDWALASIIDVALLAVTLVALVTPRAASFEWMLVLLTARPAVAFVMALTDPVAP